MCEQGGNIECEDGECEHGVCEQGGNIVCEQGEQYSV